MFSEDTNIVPEITFPIIPDNADEDLQEYLRELHLVIEEALRWALYSKKIWDGGGLECGGWDGKLVIEDHTASDTLTNAETGSVHTNKGAGGAITLTLPDPGAEGTTFTFVQGAGPPERTLFIEPQTAAIRDSVGQGAGLYKWCDDFGDSITIVCDSAADWVVISKYGVWTEEI